MTTPLQKVAITRIATTLTCRGYSDDTFDISGEGVDLDDDDCANDSIREAIIKLPDGSGIIVRGQYGHVGPGWLLSFAPLDEDKTAPSAVLEQDGYSMKFKVDVPEGTVVTLQRLL